MHICKYEYKYEHEYKYRYEYKLDMNKHIDINISINMCIYIYYTNTYLCINLILGSNTQPYPILLNLVDGAGRILGNIPRNSRASKTQKEIRCSAGQRSWGKGPPCAVDLRRGGHSWKKSRVYMRVSINGGSPKVSI